MNYADIMNLSHYELRYHKRMSRDERAAQFSSFAALSGFSEDIREERRLTQKQIEMLEDRKQILDRRLQEIEKQIKEKPIITIIYFEKDKKKVGGEYIEYTGYIKRIDEVSKSIYFSDNKRIEIKNLIDII